MVSIRTHRYLSVIIFIPALISLIAFQLEMISLLQMIITNIVVSIGEMILFVFAAKKVLMPNSMIESSRVLIPKGKFCDKSVPANTYVFEKYIIPTNTMRNCIFRICVEMAEKLGSLQLSVIRTCEEGTCEQKIDASHFLANALYINVDPREKLNFRFDKNIKIKLFSVEEFYIP